MLNTSHFLVTLALFSYNQEDFIEEAIKSALDQDYHPLEIIISDDNSSDNTFKIIEETIRNYQGLHKIILNKNHRNLGLAKHVNYIFDLASGDLIVAAAGDDISFPSRVSRLADIYIKFQPFLIHSPVIKINKGGEILNIEYPPIFKKEFSIFEMATELGLYIGASGAWSKKLYVTYGKISHENAYEDLIFGFRAALENSIHYINEPLLKYRIGTGVSTKGINFRNGLFGAYCDRWRQLACNIDVYEQRLDDLKINRNFKEKHALAKVLNKNLLTQKARIAFYKDPHYIFSELFSKRFLIAIEFLFREFSHATLILVKFFSHLIFNKKSIE